MKNLFSFPKRMLALLLLLSSTTVWAQEERNLSPVSGTYAITQATIVQAPGRKIEQGTLIIKDGLIKAAGRNIPVPPEAIVIKADSMFVYAGFIDGLSHVGALKPKEDNKEKIKDPGNPPPDRAGITPEADVRSALNPEDKSIEELRAVGFTTAHVVPYGRMLPGSGAIVFLHGNTVDKMVLVPKSSMYAEFTGADRIYPNTVIAIMAKWRELHKQASLAKSYEAVYAANRTGLERPRTDRILEAFYPVIDKRVPVIFHAQKILEAQRAMTLQADLGFQLMIGDLKEGWDLIPKLKSSGTKVFLSLELPEEKKEDKKEDTQSESATLQKEREALEKRKKEFLEKYNGQAAAFQKEGLPFGFSTMTVKVKDIQANLRKMIKAGLSEDHALAALTTAPAQLLGLSDRLGSIDNGKIANLVISDKPYFDENSKVRYVFVDGVLYKIDSGEKSKSDAPKVDVAGSWTVTMETPQGKSDEKLVLKKEGKAYTGTLSGGLLPQPNTIKSVEVEGSTLKYKYTIQFSGQTYDVEVVAVVDGETFKGNANMGEKGSFPVEGKKEPNR